MQVKAIIWDLGGVVYSFDQGVFDRNIALVQHSGKTLPEIRNILYGTSGREYNAGLMEAFNKGEISPHEFHRAVCQHLGIELPYEEFKHLWTNIFTLNKAIAQFIQQRKQQGFPQAVLSSINELNVEKVNQIFPIEQLLGKKHMIYTCRHGMKKPDPRLFDFALESLGKRKEEVVYVDDIKKYTDAAIAYGLQVVHVDLAHADFQQRTIKKLETMMQ
ncbi:HAD-IA family hydrolase [Candidatus Woesearchaeota archaeon]|nr:HAD-IA family hydrolase [Candidatus Woesearchaeota archaeon]